MNYKIYKFKDLKDGEIREESAVNEDKAWYELLGYHVCKYSEAVYVHEIKNKDWKLIGVED